LFDAPERGARLMIIARLLIKNGAHRQRDGPHAGAMS
jgi:hypothetical protein